MDQRILIFTGGNLSDWALDEIQEGDYLIGADRGAHFLVEHGRTPNLAVGDFDSVNSEEMNYIEQHSLETRAFDPVDKDWTDTELAYDMAIAKTPQEIILIGALGTRFDHSLANVHLLLKGLRSGIPSKIVDEKNEIIVADKPITIYKGKYSNVSLLPLTPEVQGITLEGFLYPLHNAVLTMGQSLGISNRLLSDKGTVEINKGQVLIIKSKD
ncbi:thiamine pyrophosphokinase [Paenibacillus swuensis]|uniref:Thiamine diphosphokinase n=1 Tax=Paenibacillus swuensis TaxID=1178515 RepID=A0A172TL94_9BACL|nr:thiamine diphosphokinase [Paenibacillus swuensis]ANE47811.1 thiamine pyrophosphokinase [Paenibacillus swuensis]